MNSETKTQIGALTSTRAIAAILVVIHHYGCGIFPFNVSTNIFHSGNVAVSYFFVLSGFVLYIAHCDKPIDYFHYLKRRAARIFPLYYFAMLFTVFAIWQGYQLPANIKQQVFYSSLFIQSYVPSYPLCLNSPAWSISVEMFFYLLFPFLLTLLQKKIKIFTLFCVLFFVVSQWLHLKYFPQRYSLSDNIVDPVFFSPMIHVSQFMIGMTGGYLFKRTQNKPPLPGFYPPLIFAAILLIIAFRPVNISYQVGLVAPLFALLIIAIARSSPVILKLPFFVFLGEISYGIYILQFPVFSYLCTLNGKYHFIASEKFFYPELLCLLVVTIALHYMIERPLRKLINGNS